MGRARWILVAATALLLGWWVSMRAGVAGERVTDEDIAKMWGRSHTIMEQQRGSLQELLDGFLTGDQEVIRRSVAHIAREMHRVAQMFPPEQPRSEQWKAMAEIVTEVRLLEDAADARQYDKAYVHFARLTQRCITCHQVSRQWGTLPEAMSPATPQPSGGVPAAPEGAPAAEDGGAPPH